MSPSVPGRRDRGQDHRPGTPGSPRPASEEDRLPAAWRLLTPRPPGRDMPCRLKRFGHQNTAAGRQTSGAEGRAGPRASTPSLCFQNITARGGDSGQPEGTGGLRSACFPSAAADTSSWAWDRAPQPQAPGGRPRGMARAAAGPGMLPGGTGLGVESPRCPLEKLRTRNRFESVTTAQPCPQAAFLPPVSSFH